MSGNQKKAEFFMPTNVQQGIAHHVEELKRILNTINNAKALGSDTVFEIQLAHSHKPIQKSLKLLDNLFVIAQRLNTEKEFMRIVLWHGMPDLATLGYPTSSLPDWLSR